MSEIRLVGVTRAFGTVRALDDVSIEVAEGELLTLLGPSGCGKTTLLRIVAGLERPDSGQVFIGGDDVTSRPTREAANRLYQREGFEVRDTNVYRYDLRG